MGPKQAFLRKPAWPTLRVTRKRFSQSVTPLDRIAALITAASLANDCRAP